MSVCTEIKDDNDVVKGGDSCEESGSDSDCVKGGVLDTSLYGRSRALGNKCSSRGTIDPFIAPPRLPPQSLIKGTTRRRRGKCPHPLLPFLQDQPTVF